MFDGKLVLESELLGDDTVVVHVKGDLDMLTVPQLDQFLRDQFRDSAATRLVLDLGDLTFLGSNGISLLIGVRQGRYPGLRGMRLVGVRRNRIVHRALELTGLLDTFDIHESVSDLDRR